MGMVVVVDLDSYRLVEDNHHLEGDDHHLVEDRHHPVTDNHYLKEDNHCLKEDNHHFVRVDNQLLKGQYFDRIDYRHVVVDQMEDNHQHHCHHCHHWKYHILLVNMGFHLALTAAIWCRHILLITSKIQ